MENAIEQSIVTGGSLALFFMLVALIPAILCIVLFFKVWIMTNDVSKIRDILQEQLDLEHPYVEGRKSSEDRENKKL